MTAFMNNKGVHTRHCEPRRWRGVAICQIETELSDRDVASRQGGSLLAMTNQMIWKAR